MAGDERQVRNRASVGYVAICWSYKDGKRERKENLKDLKKKPAGT